MNPDIDELSTIVLESFLETVRKHTGQEENFTTALSSAAIVMGEEIACSVMPMLVVSRWIIIHTPEGPLTREQFDRDTWDLGEAVYHITPSFPERPTFAALGAAFKSCGQPHG